MKLNQKRAIAYAISAKNAEANYDYIIVSGLRKDFEAYCKNHRGTRNQKLAWYMRKIKGARK